VLIGVGFATQDGDDPRALVDVLELMVRATRAAGDDAGSDRLLASIDRLLIPRGTWTYPAPGRFVARSVGADRAHPVLADLGVPQLHLVNDALASIGRGDADVVAVVGGEARRREVAARRAGIDLPEVDQGDLEPDERMELVDELVAPAEREARVVLPMHQYALIENALGHAESRTVAQHEHDIDVLWAGFDAVARSNPRAAFPGERSAEWLRTIGPGNRPLAFPYNKWHITQMNVDQAVALVFASSAVADELGIARGQRIHPHVSVESSLAVSLSRRREIHRWPAMGVLGRATSEHLGRSLATIEHVELYSCFPVAVRVQQRELGLPIDGVPTITGGMAFAGGPLNSFVPHEIGEMALRLRAHPGERGLVSAVSGLLTKPGLSVWSTAPADDEPLVADLKEQARAATETVDSVVGYEGPATIATYTVTYDETGAPEKVIAIGDTPEGTRCVATADDARLAARGVEQDLIGTPIKAAGTAFEA